MDFIPGEIIELESGSFGYVAWVNHNRISSVPCSVMIHLTDENCQPLTKEKAVKFAEQYQAISTHDYRF